MHSKQYKYKIIITIQLYPSSDNFKSVAAGKIAVLFDVNVIGLNVELLEPNSLYVRA